MRFRVLAAALALSVVAFRGVGFTAAPPQARDFFFDAFGVELGLPHTHVTRAVQTRDGYLWIGTPAGLARFDGVRFTSFRTSNTPALASSAIRSLHEDREGNLWIGTDLGLVRRRGARFEHLGLADAIITSFAEERGAGGLWIATWGRGLFRWRDGRLEPAPFNASLPTGYIRFAALDADGRLWLGFRDHGGVVCVENGAVRRFDADGRMGDEIQAMAEWPRGTLWFGGLRHGLFRWRDGALRRFTPADGLGSLRVTDLRAAQGGGLWVSAGSLHRITEPDAPVFSTIWTLRGAGIAEVCEDREGNVWICAREDGLVRARPMPYRLIGEADGLPGSIVRSVTQDPAGNIWAAVHESDFARVAPDGAVQAVATLGGAPTRGAGVLFAARDGSLWAAFNELCIWREGRAELRPEIPAVRSMFQDRSGAIWLGTQLDGLMRFRDGRFERITDAAGQALPAVTSFSEAPDGALYAGCWNHGLFKIVGDVATPMSQSAPGLPNDEVRAVHADAEGRIWVGLRGRGLAVWEAGRWFNSDELCEAVGAHVTAIVEDARGQLWLGTPMGVMWAEKSELLAMARGAAPRPRLHVAGASDGFQITPVWSGGQPVAWKTADNQLLFATRKGIVAIDPDRIPTNSVPPTVQIERVAVDERALEPSGPIELPAGTRTVKIAYTAMSFLQGHRVMFQYRLDGYDDDWREAGPERAATYTNLPPGRYVFRVKACNSDGVWNEDGAAIALRQLPRFYETWWFYALVAAGLAGGAIGLHRWRTAFWRRENERLERGIADRTRELALSNTAKTELLETISHELRNPLNGLNGLLELLGREPLGDRARELAGSIQGCARSLTRVSTEVLDHAQLEHGGVAHIETAFSAEALLRELVESFAYPARQHGVEIRVTLPEGLVDGFCGEEAKIKTILGNFISNALKYAPGSPIELAAEETSAEGDHVEISFEVRDQGPGVPLEEQELIFRKFVRGSSARRDQVIGAGLGLATCSVLARAMGGHVGVESEPGRGAVFFLHAPLQRQRIAAAAARRPIARSAAAPAALIVEDEPYNQRVLESIARELGYDVERAGTAEEAIAWLERRAFDVVFLDWELPRANGAEVARRVRPRPDGGRPLILATTALDSADRRRACREAGMDEFIAKPYTLEQVRQAIARARAAEITSAIDADGEDSRYPFRRYAQAAGVDEAEAARSFAVSLTREVAELREAARADDRERAARAAHRLRALGGLVRAGAMTALAESIEARAARSSRAELDELIASASFAAEALKTSLAAADESSELRRPAGARA